MRLFQRLGWACPFLMSAVFIAGCNSNKKETASTAETQTEVTLKVLVVDAPEITANAGRRWSAEGLGEAVFTEVTAEEFSRSDFKLDPTIDVVIYPATYAADLIADSQVMPIPKKYLDNETTNRKEMLPHQQKFLQRFGSDVYTLPLGEVYLMLMYNQKVFEELELEVPVTWKDYADVASKLRAAGHEVQEPTGDGWASRLFLSRAAAYVRSRGKISTVFEVNSMKPLINDPPFPRVLDEMKAAYVDQSEALLTPAVIYQNLLSGKAAMGLTWPSKNFSNDDSPVNEDLAVAMLPGAREWYNRLENKWSTRDREDSIHMPLLGTTGLVASVNNSSGYATVAIEFASWICSKATSTSVSIESPSVSMFRATHLGQPSRWAGEKISPMAADQFGEITKQISESEIVFLFPRVPGQADYLAELDAQVIAFLRGETTAAEALSIVTEKWNQITESRDRDRQIKMLRRSEGFSN